MMTMDDDGWLCVCVCVGGGDGGVCVLVGGCMSSVGVVY